MLCVPALDWQQLRLLLLPRQRRGQKTHVFALWLFPGISIRDERLHITFGGVGMHPHEDIHVEPVKEILKFFSEKH